MNQPVDLESGWRPCFSGQLSEEEEQSTQPARVASHLGSRLVCLTAAGEVSLMATQLQACGDLAVGDWVLLDQQGQRGVRRLERETLIARKAAGEKADLQLIAANVDTLFIVSSCNNDFNPSRLERYLAIAAQADVTPIVVLTKADLCEDPQLLKQQAARLASGLIVETVDARDATTADVLSTWCGVGQTIALVGSSGAGKSTLAMTLGATDLATQGIREDDSKGRHTTTARSLHRLTAGGWLIDTPGMRELQLAACETGVDDVFDEIVTLAEACRFRDCSHQNEPGCAIQAAIEDGSLDPRRLKNYRKLQAEQSRNSQTLQERREQSRKLGQHYKSVQRAKRKLKE